MESADVVTTAAAPAMRAVRTRRRLAVRRQQSRNEDDASLEAAGGLAAVSLGRVFQAVGVFDGGGQDALFSEPQNG